MSITNVYYYSCRWILEARELPILSMLENIACNICTRYVKMQKEAQKWTGQICPKIRQKVQENADYAANCFATEYGRSTFKVLSNGAL